MLSTLPPPSVMIVSAQREAKRWPRGEPPAWQIGTRPCGERGALIGPRQRKYLPSWWMGWTLLPSANIGLSRSSTTASGSHASHSRVTMSANSSAMS